VIIKFIDGPGDGALESRRPWRHRGSRLVCRTFFGQPVDSFQPLVLLRVGQSVQMSFEFSGMSFAF
jgi:hypothetical protein